MKKGILAVLLGAVLIFAAGFVVASETSSTESEKERSNKLLNEADSHTQSAFGDLPQATKEYMKAKPEIVKRFTTGEPTFMAIVDTHFPKAQPQEIQFIYEKLKDKGKNYFYNDLGTPDQRFDESIKEKVKNN